MICRKLKFTVSGSAIMFPDANSSFPEHKIGVFVLFGASKPSFSGVSSTKSGFLCFFGLRNPCFRAFRAQNRGFCALFGFETLVFGHFEHKIEVFVRFWLSESPFLGISSTKLGFLCAFSRDGGVCRHGNLIAAPPAWVRRGILVGSSCGWLLRLCGLRPWRGLRWLLL